IAAKALAHHRHRSTLGLSLVLLPWLLSSGLCKLDRGRRAGWQRPRIDLDHAVSQTRAIGGEPLGERRRRAAVGEPVLVAMPRAGHAAVDDAAFAERTVLMGAEVGQRADLLAVAEHGDALAVRRRHDARALVGDRGRR